MRADEQADDGEVATMTVPAAPVRAGPGPRPSRPALPTAAHPQATVLVIDDEQPNLDLVGRVLARAGYERVVLTRDPLWALGALEDLAPDLVLIDMHMPGTDGFEVLRRLQATVPTDDLLPRLVITADATEGTRRAALQLGAHDFLTKPVDVGETVLRVGNLLQTRMLHVRLREHNSRLEERVRERTGQLERSHRELATRLALVGEYRDDNTSEHTARVGHAARRLAEAVGFGPEEAALLGEAAPLHDIGKVAVPDAVLLKPGPLTPEEYEVVKTHAAVGAHLLGGGDSALLRLAEQVAHSHHERWDGDGYPLRLRGTEIPLAGRVVAVVDVFDALTHERSYKQAWSAERAVALMREERGRHFDPEVLDVFLGQEPPA
jgi:putative two-component system response regulator